jgi:hypothetical protein
LMLELFVGLKDTSTVEPLMEAYRNPAFAGIKRKLTSAFWNSKLDFSAYLSDFVLFAIEGDFMDTFEAITLIEQFEAIISESAIMESQLLLKEYLIIDSKGQILVRNTSIGSSFDVNTAAFSAGHYNIVVLTQSGVSSAKFVKQ